jgi:hypothetical protein
MKNKRRRRERMKETNEEDEKERTDQDDPVQMWIHVRALGPEYMHSTTLLKVVFISVSVHVPIFCSLVQIKAWGHNKKMGLAKKGKNEKQTKKTRKNEGDK